MEEKKEIKVKLSTVLNIMIIVVLILAVGGLCWYIYYLKNNNNAANQSTLNETNTAANTADINTADPYANYKNIAWTRTTTINYPSRDLTMSAWIDSSGIINVVYPATDSDPKQESTINSLPEKAKYITIIGQVQDTGGETILVMTENNNLYTVSHMYSNNNPDIEKILSNIVEIYKDPQLYDINSNVQIPTTLGGGGGGTFTGIYALTGDGKLLSINESYNSNTDTVSYVLGLPYEDCNPIKGMVFMNANTIQITKDDYLRDGSDIQANYIVDDNNNKITAKYCFDALDNNGKETLYVVTLDNQIYYAGMDDYSGKYSAAMLLNNKTVKNINYKVIQDTSISIMNDGLVTVTYTDNTTDQYTTPGGSGDISYYKYGF